MKKLLAGLILLGLTTQVFAQIKTETLSEVEVKGVNYMYISKIGNISEEANPVQKLHIKVASFDVLADNLYLDQYETYYYSFYIPEGYILALYDKEGVLLRTAEKFKNIQIPRNVTEAIMTEHPGWDIVSDIYYVSYHHVNGITKKYKVKLSKDGKFKRIKIDADGDFL